MRTQLINALVATATEDPGFDPNATAGKIRGFLLVLIALALAACTLYGIFNFGRQGQVSRALMMVGAVLVCLLPVAIAAPIALGKDIFSWLGF